MTTATADPAPTAAAPVYSENYKRLVLFLLVAAYTFNFIDRTIIAAIGQAIKEDLKITDTQLGLLGGLYFALLYTVLGIPLARLAERVSRVNIISAAIVIWSGFTALCGTAASFASLAAFRFGVGVGEAGLSPPAQSLISDYFEPKRRASALSVYSFGIPLGTMIGAVLGGFLAQNFSWRVAFMVVGIPGVLIALALKLLVKEPPRGHSEPAGMVTAPLEPWSVGKEMRDMGAVLKILFGSWPVFNMLMGITLVSFAGYGGGQFVQPYFIRLYGLNYAQVGLIVGLVAGASQGLGTLAGGVISDRLSRFGARWYALVPAIGVTAAYPFVVGIYTSPTWVQAAFFLAVPGIFSYTYLGPTFGVMQNMAPTRLRATTAAVMLFFLNLIALGGGPPFTGWVIDHFSAFHHANPGDRSIWGAVSHFAASDPATFQAACPGGKAAPGAAADAAAACKSALQQGTRNGVILSYGFYLWGAFHYLLASFGIGKAMQRARDLRGEA